MVIKNKRHKEIKIDANDILKDIFTRHRNTLTKCNSDSDIFYEEDTNCRKFDANNKLERKNKSKYTYSTILLVEKKNKSFRKNFLKAITRKIIIRRKNEGKNQRKLIYGKKFDFRKEPYISNSSIHFGEKSHLVTLKAKKKFKFRLLKKDRKKIRLKRKKEKNIIIENRKCFTINNSSTKDKVPLTEMEKLQLYTKVRNILDSMKLEILLGDFLPTRENLISIDNEISKLRGDKHVNKIISRWLQKNTNFNNISELKEYFLGKTLSAEVYDVLNNNKEKIILGSFIPTLENVIKANPKLLHLGKKKQISNLISYWIKTNTPYQNIKEIREKFDHDQILFKQLRKFLDSIKEEIITGEIIPDQETIIALEGKFRNIKNKNEFSHRITRWIKKNTNFENLNDLIANATEIGKLKEELRSTLDSLRGKIITGKFIPTEDNIISYNRKFERLNNNRIIYNIIRWWLQSNTEFSNITELIEKFIDKKPSTKLIEILDSRREEILSGKFIPNKLNLRKFYPKLEDYESSHKVVAKWLEENSDGRFKSISDLIEYYKDDLNPEDLGHCEPSDYTFKFFQEDFRVTNAWSQVVRKLDKDRIQQINQKYPIKTWKAFFKFLKKNPQWKFVCIITGEIIKHRDYLLGNIRFHHNDGNKKNDNEMNLFHILTGIHGIINNAELYWEELKNFFENLVISNYIDIKNGTIPRSWVIGWRNCAREQGIRLPSYKYLRKGKKNKKFVKTKKYIKPLDDF